MARRPAIHVRMKTYSGKELDIMLSPPLSLLQRMFSVREASAQPAAVVLRHRDLPDI